MRDLEKVKQLYVELYKELGTYEQMHDPEISALAMAKVDLLYTDGYCEPNVKRDFTVCFPCPENTSRNIILEMTNMRMYTRCEHHGLPFFGFIHMAYIPDKKVVGLSKPARVVEHFSHKYQMQEALVAEVADYLYDMLEPVALVVQCDAIHLCSIMRGVRTPDETVTVRTERVNEEIYKSHEREGHLYHLTKDLLSKTFKTMSIARFLQ